jgi:hypothetical protein
MRPVRARGEVRAERDNFCEAEGKFFACKWGNGSVRERAGAPLRRNRSDDAGVADWEWILLASEAAMIFCTSNGKVTAP